MRISCQYTARLTRSLGPSSAHHAGDLAEGPQAVRQLRCGVEVLVAPGEHVEVPVTSSCRTHERPAFQKWLWN